MTAYQATMIAGIMGFLAEKITAVCFEDFHDKEGGGLGIGSIEVSIKNDTTKRYDVGGKWGADGRWAKGRDVWVHGCVDLSVEALLDSYRISEDAPDNLFSDRWMDGRIYSIPPTEDKRVFDFSHTLESLETLFEAIDAYRWEREKMRECAEVVVNDSELTISTN